MFGVLGVDVSSLRDVSFMLFCFWGILEGYRLRFGFLGFENGRVVVFVGG